MLVSRQDFIKDFELFGEVSQHNISNRRPMEIDEIRGRFWRDHRLNPHLSPSAPAPRAAVRQSPLHGVVLVLPGRVQSTQLLLRPLLLRSTLILILDAMPATVDVEHDAGATYPVVGGQKSLCWLAWGLPEVEEA